MLSCHNPKGNVILSAGDAQGFGRCPKTSAILLGQYARPLGNENGGTDPPGLFPGVDPNVCSSR
jgi:hypothetical protein